MTIILRIYFAGLISFIPGYSDSDMTVVLVDATEGYYASDGGMVHEHHPWLLARAGSCAGDCQEDKVRAADFFYEDLLIDALPEDLMAHLDEALHGGGAWRLLGSDLNLNLPGPRGAALSMRNAGARGKWPLRAEERDDFKWVTAIEEIDPTAGQVDPDVLAATPRKGLIVARIDLDRGTIRTHRLIRDNDDVRPVDFRRLRDVDAGVVHSQALARWVVAEIPVNGCEVELVERRFSEPGARRVMTLRPEKCEEGAVIELALLNLPKSDFQLTGRRQPTKERLGRHFEMYYELSNQRPPNRQRPVPFDFSEDGIPWTDLYPEGGELSDFLDKITLPDLRTISTPVLCPGVRFSMPGS